MREFVGKVFAGDCLDVMPRIPGGRIDAIFADPPYNLQLGPKVLYRADDHSAARAVRDPWDNFGSAEEYDEFTKKWVSECKRLLKPDGVLWAIGTYHNIFRIGAILQDAGFWVLNDIIWVKTNPMPNFKGTRFANAHETMIWATPRKTGKYTFNYETMKQYNNGKQMRSDWQIDICLGAERLKDANGKSLHSTQKPLELLRRVILASTKAGEIILDPFFGSGTTGAAAKELSRKFIGIEQDESYVAAARERIKSVVPVDLSKIEVAKPKREEERIAFMELISGGLLDVGQTLVGKRGDRVMITHDGLLAHTLLGRASIHVMAARIQNVASYNGWDYWFAEKKDGTTVSIDEIRKLYRTVKKQMAA
ncbi:MAG: site-specific DNA-methyltransferase [Rickettsiales bacterium]|nr:site-specific DNA-methyltransferase [Rickettsiales bacterium]